MWFVARAIQGNYKMEGLQGLIQLGASPRATISLHACGQGLRLFAGPRPM